MVFAGFKKNLAFYVLLYKILKMSQCAEGESKKSGQTFVRYEC